MLVMPPLKDPGESHMNMQQMCNSDQMPVMYEPQEDWLGVGSEGNAHDVIQWGTQEQHDQAMMMMMLPQDPSQCSFGMQMPTEFWHMTDQQSMQDMSAAWAPQLIPPPQQFNVNADAVQFLEAPAPTLLQVKKQKGFQNKKIVKETPDSPSESSVATTASPHSSSVGPDFSPQASSVAPDFSPQTRSVAPATPVAATPTAAQKSRGFQNKKLGSGPLDLSQAPAQTLVPALSVLPTPPVLRLETRAELDRRVSSIKALNLEPCTRPMPRQPRVVPPPAKMVLKSSDEIVSQGIFKSKDLTADHSPINMARLQNGVFDLASMMRFRHTCLEDSDEHMLLSVAPRVSVASPKSAKDQRRELSHIKQQDNATSKSKRKDEKPLMPSETGYKRTTPATRQAEIARSVTSLLNKICPDNQDVIVEKLAQVELYTADELAQVIEIIFAKALDEPHYCKTYADMVSALKTRYPEFPALDGDDKPLTFVRVLLNTCQHEFERLLVTLAPLEDENIAPEDLDHYKAKKKTRALANMKFIGHLFLQKLLVGKVMYTVVHDLLNPSEGLPEEHMVECVCELFTHIGYLLSSTRPGDECVSRNFQRIENLKYCKNADSTPLLSKRVGFLIQDLLDLRDNDWEKKIFKEQAKTMDDIKKDAITECPTESSKGGHRRRPPANGRMRA